MNRIDEFDAINNQVIFGTNDNWKNANPAGGIEGSIPPEESLRHPQEEIVNAIEQAGLTPDENDLTQLWQAINITGWIKADVTYTIGSDAGDDYTDINAAMTDLRYRLIADGAVVTLALRAEGHIATADIVVEHVHAHRINIVGAALPGADPVSADFAMTGNNATARGNDATSNLTMLQGKYDSEINMQGFQFRIENCHLGLLDDLLIRGDGTVIYGLEIQRGGVNLGTISLHGFGDDQCFVREGHVRVTAVFTASGGTQDGVEVSQGSFVAVSGAEILSYGNGANGIESRLGGRISAGNAVAEGNSKDGISIVFGGSMDFSLLVSNTNGSNGVDVNGHIAVDAGSGSQFNNNASAGALIRSGNAVLNDAEFKNNGTYGLYSLESAQADAQGGVFSGNGSNSVKAWLVSSARVTGATGTSDATPTVNTSGNLNSYIYK